MRLTLRQLQIFAAVADAGSTAAGADRAALSQSAASAAINELEGLLQARLFDRVGKRLVINDNGRLLLPQARQMLDAAATIERQFAAAGEGGSGLCIGASTTIGSYVLPAILAALHGGSGRAAPRVVIANSAAVAAAVAAFEVDAGLIEGPCHEPQVVAEPWIEDELIVVCWPGHTVLGAGRTRKATLAALRDAGWLLREPGSGTREAVEHALLPHLHRLRPAGEFGNSEAIKHAAAEGLGIACLSRSVVADLLASGRLVEVATPLPPLTRRFFLIRQRDKILSARLAAFLQMCREWVPAPRGRRS
ncbi:MAG: LysR family transcriptional regulator [Burkholderiaceae bacterium]